MENSEELTNVRQEPDTLLYIQQRSKGINRYQAALAAGFTQSVARVASSKIENTQKYKELVDELWPDEVLHMRTMEGLDATTPDKFGNQYADFEVRRKYLDMIYRLKGRFNKEKK